MLKLIIAIGHECKFKMTCDVAGLQSISWDSRDNDMRAMFVPHTVEVNEIPLLKIHQHGHHDVTCKAPSHKPSHITQGTNHHTFTNGTIRTLFSKFKALFLNFIG